MTASSRPKIPSMLAIALIAVLAAIVLLAILGPAPASAQQYYYGNDPFWNSYYAAQNGYNSVPDNSGTEALINEMRAQRGAPPCAFGLFWQLAQDRPPC